MSERKYVLARIRTGDYICLGNDGRTVWRFRKYQDGRAMGLDVNYELRDFWKAEWTPASYEALLCVDTLDDLQWHEAACNLLSRKEAIETMTARS